MTQIRDEKKQVLDNQMNIIQEEKSKIEAEIQVRLSSKKVHGFLNFKFLIMISNR